MNSGRMTRLEMKALALVGLVMALCAGIALGLYLRIGSSSARSDAEASARIVHLSEFLAVATAMADTTDDGEQAQEAKPFRARQALKILIAHYRDDRQIAPQLLAIDEDIAKRIVEARRQAAASGRGGEARGAPADMKAAIDLALELLGQEQQLIEGRLRDTAQSSPLGLNAWLACLALLGTAIVALAFALFFDARKWMRRVQKPDATEFLAQGQTVADRRALVAGIQASIVSSLNKSRTIGLMYINLTNLPMIRRKLGWDATDTVVADMAEKLRAQFRRSDLVARIEGDVLVVMAADVAAREELNAFAARIRRMVEAFAIDALPDVRLAVDIGSAMYPIDGYSAEDMLTAARASLSANTVEGGIRAPANPSIRLAYATPPRA